MPPGQPLGGVARHLLVPEAGLVRPVGEPVEVDGPVVQVGDHERRHLGVVADELPLGDGRLALSAREEHLVEVGELELLALEGPGAGLAQGVEGGQLLVGGRVPRGRRAAAQLDGGLGRGPVAVPLHVGGGQHLVVGAPGLDRPGVLLRVPSRAGRARPSCAGAATAPWLALVLVPVGADEDEAPGQLLALEVEVELALVDGGGRVGVVRAGRLPRPPVPHDHVAPAVGALGDDALEVEVLDGVVLHVDGQPAGLGVERRPLGHGPAGQHPLDLQPEVVVQPAGPVPLDHVPPGRCSRVGRPARPPRRPTARR